MPIQTFRIALAALFLSLPLALGACSASKDPMELCNSGSAALAKGDHQAACESFSAALERLEPASPEYKRALLGIVEAKSAIDAGSAGDTFLAFAKDHPDRVDANDYQKIGLRISEKDLTKAITVLDEGKRRFADNGKLAEAIDLMKTKAASSNDTSAINALRGLGYVGGK